MKISPGTIFLNRFRIEDPLFSTESSSRYRGFDLKRSLPLLIKVFDFSIEPDDTVLCFQQNSLTLQTIQHPNVIPFYGLYKDQGISFLIEKFIEGPTLAQILRQRNGKPMPADESLIYLKALATALEYIHGFGLVHCTIEPANIQATRDGSIMLGNFGFARLIDKPMSTTGIVGPPLYQAPEQLRGDRVYPNTDVYALGILFFEFLTGKHPFLGEPGYLSGGGKALTDRLREAHLYQPPPDLHQFNPTLPSGLSQSVHTALSKDPKERYQSTQEMLEICSAVLGTSPAQIPSRIGGRDSASPTQVIPAGTQKSPVPGTPNASYTPIAATAVVQPQEFKAQSGTQVIPEQSWQAGQPNYSPPVSQPVDYLPDSPSKPRRPAWLLPLIGLMIGGLLLCGAVGVWAGWPILQEMFATASPTPTYTVTAIPTATIELPTPTLPPTATPEPIIVPPTEPPPTLAPTEPPPATSTPERTSFKVTIRNNESFPIYAFRNGTVMGTDPIPPGKFIWYLNIPGGQHYFRFCLDLSQSQCPVEKQVLVNDDITIGVP
jgi:serine/threonine protein kinase